MNVLDSDKLAGVLEAEGYRRAASERDADVILLNTCSVREGAAHKVFTELGRLKKLKNNRSLILGVVGCVAQQEGETIFKRAPYVDLVMGPRGILCLPELLKQARHERAIDTAFHEDSVLFPDELIARSHPTKAYLTVMEGCNKRCSFCIVPATRGREICRPMGDILDEARRAIDAGYLEIELLGQNVNCWKHGRHRFLDLMEKVSDLDGLKRLRFTTSHPRHFQIGVADLMASKDVICPYIHLPLQAGSDRILKLMKRQYDRQWYLDLVQAIRERVPSVVFSTDVIVAFPTETEGDFEETIGMVRRIEFDTMFSFRFSPRPGTQASAMEGQLPIEVGKMRHQVLLCEQALIQKRRFGEYRGRLVEVLVESRSEKGESWAGRTPCNKIVHFTARLPISPGKLTQVRITRPGLNSLSGVEETG